MDFELPEELVARDYRLRPEVEQDMPFLSALYASTREGELAGILNWSVTDKQAFCDQQFMAQRRHYRSQIPNCDYWIISHDGKPVGRLYIEERVTQVHVVDIALVPEHRGLGVGLAILRALAEVAASQDKAVGIFVEKYNPALRLYRRLGFVPIGQTDLYLEMERPVDAAMQPVN
jgi:ribosomal protein S18 acetylase RimI-like enzyme